MNAFTIETLGRPAVRTLSARAMTTVPGSHRTVRFMHPPAERAFAAFLAALRHAKPSDPTACAGWTVHELTAHLAAGSAEIADLIDLELAGAPPRATKPFEEREAPFLALTRKRLRRRFVEESLRATVAIERLRRAGPDARVLFTGARLDADTLILHAESELALHRWDIVGDDDVSLELLSDPRLARHAVRTVATMTPNVFAARTNETHQKHAANDTNETVVLRVAGEHDVIVRPDGGLAITDAGDGRGDRIVDCHPAVRTLLLWGRHPAPHLRIRWTLRLPSAPAVAG